MDSAWIQRPVKLIQSDSDGVIIIQTDSDKFQKNSDRFSLIQNFLFMRVEEELYYPSSENKGADQLRGYREVDLRLCFRLSRLFVFP